MFRVPIFNQTRRRGDAGTRGETLSLCLRVPVSPRRYYLRSSSAHFRDRAVAVAGLKFDWPHRIFPGFDFESVLERVEHGAFHTVVSCESTDDKFCDVLLAKLRSEISFVECRITICIAEAF